jgi:CubicO group peptidase (beta-lactamase class C family)
MQKTLLLSLATVLGALPAFAQDTVVEARIRRVENGLLTPVIVARRTDQGAPIAERMRAFNTPAVSIALINNGRVEWARAYGTLRRGGAAADTATLFQAASISKPVAVLGALMLVEQGRLSLDADVNTFLRSWRVPENAFTAREKVTLRRLASHTAGLSTSGFPGYPMSAELPTTLQVLDGLPPTNTAPVRVDTVPGSVMRYSGGGMQVMQLLMEDVTGRPFALFMRDNVLRPLGMVHSSFDCEVDAERAARVARAHNRDGDPVPGGWHRYPESAAAGLWTTPSDVARFGVAVLRAWRGEEGGPVPPTVARQMLTQHSVGGPDGGFGLGLQMNGIGTPGEWFGHGGANEGYRASLIVFPATGQGAAIMTSSDLGADLVIEIARALAREYGWPAFQPVEKAAVAIPDRATLRAAPGIYRTIVEGDVIQYEVRASGGSLTIQEVSWPQPRTLYRASATEPRFFVRETEREYVFERDPSGRVASVRVTGGGGPDLVAPRVNR